MDDELVVDIELPSGVFQMRHADDAITLRSGRAVDVASWCPSGPPPPERTPFTPDERREIADEMIRRWTVWGEG